MLASLIIVFREVLEAGLVIGIVLAATRGLAGSRAWITAGIVGGVAGACVVAGFTSLIAEAFEGTGQEIFNACVLGAAVVMLTWHNVWMASHGRAMAEEMRDAGEAAASGAKPLFALAIVVGAAVLREGSEVVLFLYGVTLAANLSALSLLAGGLGGLLLGGLASAATYLGLLRIPTRYLFTVTSIMIAFLAAGMAAQAVAFLEQAGIVSALSSIVWNSADILSQTSPLGILLHTLVGYSDQPTWMELAVYLATLLAMFALMRMFASPSRPARA